MVVIQKVQRGSLSDTICCSREFRAKNPLNFQPCTAQETLLAMYASTKPSRRLSKSFYSLSIRVR